MADDLILNGTSLTTSAGFNGTAGYVTISPSITTASSLMVADGSNSLTVKGTSNFEQDANFQNDIKIKGVSLVESLKKIEERLNIMRPNKELEETWDKLRELGDQYRALEAEILEAQKILEILGK